MKRALCVLLASAAILMGCGQSGRTPSGVASPVQSSVPATSEVKAVVARASNEVRIYPSADATDVALVLPATTSFGSARALLVVGPPCDGRVEVAVPTRPNGSTGWIDTDDVELRPIDERIEVDLSARTLSFFEGDGNGGERTVFTSSVAIGSDDNPTPAGDFYVTDKLETTDPDGAYGPLAIGLSAHSFTLSEFGGGDGQIGIHGTSDPSSIGGAVSHGCIRLPNDVVVLLTDLPLGTPVRITGA